MGERTNRRKWFQFRIRTLLIFVVLLSGLFSLFGKQLSSKTVAYYRKVKYADSVAAIESKGGRVLYGNGIYFAECNPYPSVDTFKEGDKIVGVMLRGGISPDLIQHLKRLDELEVLYLSHCTVTEEGLGELKDFPTLRYLMVSDNEERQTAFNDTLNRAFSDCHVGYWGDFSLVDLKRDKDELSKR
jgi:hypothetical protein